MSQMLHIEIPNFGNTVLGCLNEQRLLGLYCDVSIVVKGQAFKAHRAVLAASSLYFRDLFSGNSKNAFELPGTVPPACFQQILSFCYTGKLTMAASEQLVVMYTAGFLQIQHIVEKGTDLMFKVSSPHCDSQTAMIEDPSSEPQSPCNQLQSASAPYVMSPSMPIPLLTRVKHENLELQAAAVPGLATKRPLEPAARDGAGGGGPAAGPLKLSRVSYYGVPNLATLLPNVQQVQYSQGERTSPGASSIPTTDSPTSYHNEEDEEDDEAYDTMVEEQYGQMYIKSSGGYSGRQEAVAGQSRGMEQEAAITQAGDGARFSLPRHQRASSWRTAKASSFLGRRWQRFSRPALTWELVVPGKEGFPAWLLQGEAWDRSDAPGAGTRNALRGWDPRGDEHISTLAKGGGRGSRREPRAATGILQQRWHAQEKAQGVQKGLQINARASPHLKHGWRAAWLLIPYVSLDLENTGLEDAGEAAEAPSI